MSISFFLNKNTLRCACYKNNLKIFQKDIFGVMACRHLVSLYLLTHLSKLRFVIISTDTISAIAVITHQITSNVLRTTLNALRTIFYEPSLRLISLKLRKAYIHSSVFDAYAAGRCTRCVNNNTSVKNHPLYSASRLFFHDYQPLAEII